MKAFSLTKIIAFVSVFFIFFAGNVTLADDAKSGGLFLTPPYNPQQSCAEAVSKVKDLWAKAVGACKGSRLGGDIKKCSKTLSECAESYEDELPITVSSADLGSNPFLSQLFDLDGGTTPACSDYTRSEYDNKERDIKRDLKETKKTLTEAKKQQSKDLEEYYKAAAEIDEKIQDAQVKKVEQDAQYGVDQRDKAEKREQSAAELQKAIDSKELEIIQYQNAIKAKIAARKNQINQYRIDLLECKIKAEEYVTKSNTGRNKQSGSFKSALGQGQSRNNTIQELFNTCVTGVLNRRTSEGEAYQGEINSLNTALGHLQANLATLKQTQAAAKARNAQADQEEVAAKQSKDALDLQQQKNLIGQKANALSVYQQKFNQNNAEIKDANLEVNKSSNDLAQFQKFKPRGKISSSDADQGISLYQSASSDCESKCRNFAEKSDCSPDQGKSNGSSTGKSTGADGKKN